MAIRDSFVHPISDGDQLNDGYFNGVVENTFKHVGSDQTAGSTASSSETKIGEVTVPADTVTNGILVIATGYGTQETSQSMTVKLRAGSSTTATSNSEYKSYSASFPDYTSTNRVEKSWTFVYFIDDLTWSNTNYVHITGSVDGAYVSKTVVCESIEVLYL